MLGINDSSLSIPNDDEERSKPSARENQLALSFFIPGTYKNANNSNEHRIITLLLAIIPGWIILVPLLLTEGILSSRDMDILNLLF